MELYRFLSILRRRALLIILAVVLAGGGAYLATPRSKVYASEATLYVGFRQFTPSATENPLSNDTMTAVQEVINSYAFMIRSTAVAAAALRLTPGLYYSPGQVVSETQTFPIANTTLLQIRVVDANPETATRLANAVSDAFVAAVQASQPSTPGPGTVPNLPTYVFQRAGVPGAPLPTSLARNVTLGILFGLVASIAVVLLVEYLDLTIKGADDAERRLGLPVLGVVPVGSRAAVGVRAQPSSSTFTKPAASA